MMGGIRKTRGNTMDVSLEKSASTKQVTKRLVLFDKKAFTESRAKRAARRSPLVEMTLTAWAWMGCRANKRDANTAHLVEWSF
jgi:hypothetical protein